MARSRVGRGTGVVIAGVGFVLVAVAIWQWAAAVAERDAIDNALDDVPGLQADVDLLLPATVAPPADAQPVEVVRVVDGDTVIVTGDPGPVLPAGGQTTIRLLEIDTPEVDGPNTTEQCFGPEASRYTSELLPVGATLQLAADQELLDRYDRTLAYAWTEDGTFVNEAILRNGYGYSALVLPNDQHIMVMTAAESAASAERRGLWGTC